MYRAQASGAFGALGSMALPFGGYNPPLVPWTPAGVSLVRACAETDTSTSRHLFYRICYLLFYRAELKSPCTHPHRHQC